MAEVVIKNGESQVTEGGKGGSANMASDIDSLVKQSKSGPVAVRFYKRNTAMALTAEQAGSDPKNAMIPYNGTLGTLHSLTSAGLIIRTPDGAYVDARGEGSAPSCSGNPPAPAQEPEPEVQPKNELEGYKMSQPGEEAFKQLQTLNAEAPKVVDFAVAKIATAGAKALQDPQFVSDIHTMTGMPKEQASRMMEAVVEEYTAAAAHAMRSYPVNPRIVFEHVRTTNPGLAAEMIHRQVGGDFSAHHRAMKSYIRDLPKIDRELAMSADLGPHARVKQVGPHVMVEIQGKTYTWADAMRLGRII